MIDINFILENKEYVKEALKKKLYEADIDGLCSMVIEKRNLQKKLKKLLTNKSKDDIIKSSKRERKSKATEIKK